MFVDIANSGSSQDFMAASAPAAAWTGHAEIAMPTIQQMVTNLRESMKEVHDKLGETDTDASPPAAEQWSSFKPQIPHEASLNLSHEASPREFEPHWDDSRPGLGDVLAAAVARAKSANRFEVVRDSVTGEPTDSLMHPKARPYAESRNVYTVRISCNSITAVEYHETV